MQPFKLIAVLCLALIWPIVPSDAQHTAACADAACPAPEPVRVGYTQFAPFSSTNTAGVAEGFSIDVIRMLLEPLGYSLAFVAFDNPGQMLAALERGEIAATSLLGRNAERERVGAFTDTITEVAIDVFSRRGAPALHAPEDLAGLRVGVSDGSAPARLVRAIDGVQVVTYPSTNGLLLPLLRQEVDAIAAPREAVLFAANTAEIRHRIQLSGLSLRTAEAGIVVAPNRTALLGAMNTAIATAKAEQGLRRIYDTWFAAPPAGLTWREHLAVGVALLAAIAAAATWLGRRRMAQRRGGGEPHRDVSLQQSIEASDVGLVLFDANMRPKWWSDIYSRSFPAHVEILAAGVPLPQLLKTIDPAPSPAQEAPRLVPGAAGRVYDWRLRPLPTGGFAVLSVDVTEMVDRNRTLTEVADQLREANLRLDDFTKLVAHDLVGPLRQMRNLQDWIVEDFDDLGTDLPKDTRENLQTIDALLDREITMVKDLLEYAKSEQPSASLTLEPGDRFAGIVGTTGISRGFTVHLPDTAPQISANPVAFDTVLRNLISNAAKHHTGDQGTIIVTAERKGGICEFSVIDDGPGIPERYREYVFEPFCTLTSRSRGGGTGLGLAFVKRSVAHWGGTFGVESRHEASGSRFWFTVPLAETELRAEKVVPLRRNTTAPAVPPAEPVRQTQG